MVLYTYTGTGKAHVITEYDSDSMEGETACGMTLQLQLNPQDTERECVEPPRLPERCGNCDRTHDWRDG